MFDDCKIVLYWKENENDEWHIDTKYFDNFNTAQEYYDSVNSHNQFIRYHCVFYNKMIVGDKVYGYMGIHSKGKM